MSAPETKFIRSVLYRLKRLFGTRIEVVWVTTDTPNLETGDKDETRDSVTVNRAIVLPTKQDRRFEYDLAFIAAAKNFTYGGTYDRTSRTFVIDAGDLPIDFEIELGFQIVYRNTMYEVAGVQEFELERAVVVVAREEENQEPKNIIKENAYSTLRLETTTEGVVE